MPAHQVGAVPERAGPDDRVPRGGVHVHRRRQVHVDADGGQVGPESPVHRPGERRVVDRAEGGVARVRTAGEVAQPGDVAPLLVDRDHRFRRRGAQRRSQRGQLLGPGDVRAEERHARKTVFQCLQQPARSGTAGERRDEDSVGEAGE